MRTGKLLIVLCLLMACKNLPAPLASLPPYEEYVRSLEKANLAESVLGRQWIEAGRLAMQDTLRYALPFSEIGSFEAETPEARSYLFEVSEGQVLNVNGRYISGGRLFSDIFIKEEERWDRIHAGDSTLSFRYEFDRSGTCLLRLQPELLSNVYYSLTVSVGPALLNPVSGAENRDIGSIYGDPRDGGARSHEGVDIFAPRGTPVIAPSEGRITRTGNTERGGKVIWMRDNQRRQAYYFAHLDSQIVRSGEYVETGDTIGLVGNTGNARTTPPHLHFGIYQRGSKDPYQFIHIPGVISSEVPDSAFVRTRYRVSVPSLNVRQGPSTNFQVITKLERHEVLVPLAQSGDWSRILLPDMTEGFVSSKLIEAIDQAPLRTLVADSVVIYQSYGSQAIPSATIQNARVSLLGSFEEEYLISLDNGKTGWIRNPEAGE